ncbi:DNA topoisomerase II, putative [Theileria equi strain WA]|uniref:DNA topoisomerase 2 n=1 Tax=Theileria equi strain WA TaxID=1537102 RepID=L0AWF0_THEEQ|nr:DNA topoisomerase II, putative [Theileria equi strain WA]AFZ79356.1 DNA topoisomerase II, putative [Theileria equi strain WA]|eukprot:XP_004829022.1 DNA topoisomerase II, putative [Theileria equi strain WA]
MAKPKTIEERYQKKSQLEHILLRPDTYIGSTEMHNQQMWVYDTEKNRMVYENVDYVPGLYKIFDEVLVNAGDVFARQQSDPSLERMTCIKVSISRETGAIVVYNDGEPIPIEVHSEHKMYVPQMIFGELLTSDNYDDSEERITGGRNGYGAKLANIFSKSFTVSVGNKKKRKKFKMTWTDNMTKTQGEPKIVPYQGNDFVKITFIPDYKRFNLTTIDDGTLKLLTKRVYDIAGTTGVKVFLNNERIPIKDFKQYVDLYFESTLDIIKIHEKVHRWEVVVSASDDNTFKQVSFVNNISTIKGGSHVTHVTDPLIQALCKKVNSKNKGGLEVKPSQIRNHLFVFINCQIVNPAFDSQTKETLTTKQTKFGSKYTMGERVLGQVLKSRITDNILRWVHERANIELKRKMKVSKTTDRLMGIPKLEDANKAGGRFGIDCTLILTEGDSAKTSCLAGLSVVGRDKYGIFPLKGKLLNVRDASYKQLTHNLEIQNILKIMGLDITKKDLSNPQGLRYGSLLIMTDQDYDGSHIKGLLINLFHCFWPKLLQHRGFIREFITPIIKAKKGDNTISFFTIEDFNRWKIGQDLSTWHIKYYKGLGTSTDKEFKEYFSNLPEHLIDFTYIDQNDDDSIDLAFSKKRVDDRKVWLQNFVHGDGIDHSIKHMRYSDFVNKELIQFSIYDTERSIPSMVDGWKPGQRKVLFGCFKRNLKNECKVAQLSGYIAEHSAYHHGETSLQQTIVNMAQDFAGSNNINVLEPCGQFGSRKEGGKDSAAPRYINTKLSYLTRLIYVVDDDAVLDYQNEEGQSIEPYYYVPVIPMVLVNGSEGIGTGFSTQIPNYNPLDIIANLKRLINNQEMLPMIPWYRKYSGTIEPNEKGGFDCMGKFTVMDDFGIVNITELPIHRWTNDYKEFLESLQLSVNGKAPLILSYLDNSTHESIHFTVNLNPDCYEEILKEGIDKILKLKTTISTTNMTLFDANKRLRRYDTVLDILRDFADIRLVFYNKRRDHLIKQLQIEQQILSNQVRFIDLVITNKIVLFKKSRNQLVSELKALNFDPYSAFSGDVVLNAASQSDPSTTRSDYNYLLSLPLWSLTLEHIKKLNDDYNAKQEQLQRIINTSATQLWQEDLDILETALIQSNLYSRTGTNTELNELSKQYLDKLIKAKIKKRNGAGEFTL